MALIEDYALLGDLQTAALVDRGGSVDWLCFPRFDSGACFAALLGNEENGRWLLSPSADATSTRRYLHDTLVLETTWKTEDGAVARVFDFMPPRRKSPDIVRIVEGVRGRVRFRSELAIRFDYGRIVPWVRKRTHEENTRVALAGPDALCFRTPVDTRGEDMRTLSEFVVDEGERVPFVLTWFPSHEDVPDAIDPEQALANTESFWREWSEHCDVDLPPEWASVVRRSLIVLKALTYEPTGAIVAAPTTSLPEWIGSVRNWDYRYCWLRDATLTLLAFLQGNHDEEAVAWRRWMQIAFTLTNDTAELSELLDVTSQSFRRSSTPRWPASTPRSSRTTSARRRFPPMRATRRAGTARRRISGPSLRGAIRALRPSSTGYGDEAIQSGGRKRLWIASLRSQ